MKAGTESLGIQSRHHPIRLPLQFFNCDDDPQPNIGAIRVAALAHALNHLPSLRHSVVAVQLEEELGGVLGVEIGGHD